MADDRRSPTDCCRSSPPRTPNPSTYVAADAYALLPHLYILILQRFNVEPNRWDGLHGLVGLVLQAVQNGGLPGIVQAKD
mmetsp:Transcript_9391/g.19184  ORF Transcript_9391/g.19184 Transcript_9391/m.19184 type:complete len:80 (-) Transcript_9391:1109-1348(-)